MKVPKQYTTRIPSAMPRDDHVTRALLKEALVHSAK